jgi:LPXTG-motif cell wall-anchored protein
VWAQVHNNTCKCGDANQCITRKAEASSTTKMLLVNYPKFQHWQSTQHADIVNKINAIKRPYSNQKVSELDNLINKGYEMAMSPERLTAAESLRAFMLAEIAQIAEEARLAEEQRLAAEAAAAAAAAQAAANVPVPNANIPGVNGALDAPHADANIPGVNEPPPSLENTIRGIMGFDATESGDSDNSNMTIMIAGALALGLMLLIIKKKRKSANNHYARTDTNNVLLS